MDIEREIDDLIAAAQKPAYLSELTSAPMSEIDAASDDLAQRRQRLIDRLHAILNPDEGTLAPLGDPSDPAYWGDEGYIGLAH